MKPEKAIEILVHYDDPLRQFTIKETKEAAKLGIEALKRVDDQRNGKVLPFDRWLPGETEGG
ncbi:unnamed protein product [marine sediment metagenome]|uniref:Uncharacterized protein n=1 Tax=marine sediment metagenome TaxID=412755 RepID=X1L0E6_9ZZZZ